MWWNSSKANQNISDDAIRCCIHYVSESGRPSNGYKVGKDLLSVNFIRKIVLKNVLAIGQLHSSSLPVRPCLKSCMLGFSITRIKHLQMSKFGLEKAEEPEIKLPTFLDHRESKGMPEKKYTFVSSAKLNPLTNQLWKVLKEIGIPDHLTCLLINLYGYQEATVRILYRTDWFKVEKGVPQDCLLSASLFNQMLTTTWEIPGWMSYMLESKSTTPDIWMISF